MIYRVNFKSILCGGQNLSLITSFIQILSLGKKKEENDGEKTEANTKI